MFFDRYKIKLFVMVGLSGSGKSFEAEKIAEQYQAQIVSLDEIERIFPVMKSKTILSPNKESFRFVLII